MADRGVPIVKFFGRENAPKLYRDCGDGRRHRLSPTEIARHSTGVDRTTGQRTLGVAVSQRQNGLVRFQADLWKLDYNLCAEARELLTDYWRTLNDGAPAVLPRKMECHFGPTVIEFDATPEQESNWREALATVLSDRGSYAHVLAGEGQ